MHITETYQHLIISSTLQSHSEKCFSGNDLFASKAKRCTLNKHAASNSPFRLSVLLLKTRNFAMLLTDHFLATDMQLKPTDCRK